jgi:hypothetical protein
MSTYSMLTWANTCVAVLVFERDWQLLLGVAQAGAEAFMAEQPNSAANPVAALPVNLGIVLHGMHEVLLNVLGSDDLFDPALRLESKRGRHSCHFILNDGVETNI